MFALEYTLFGIAVRISEQIIGERLQPGRFSLPLR